MGEFTEESANELAPIMGQIAVVALDGTSSRTNLAAAAQLGTEATKGLITMVPDGGNVYFFFNNSNAGTASSTEDGSGTPNNRTAFCPNGGRMDFALRQDPAGAGADYTWFVAKASAATLVRFYRSSGLTRKKD